jgi:predicted DNA-binding transcriptional regulator AlpA
MANEQATTKSRRQAAPLDYEHLPRAALIRLANVAEVTGRSGSAIYRDIASGTFPSPLRLMGRSTRWRWGDILDWLEKVQTQAQPFAMPPRNNKQAD